MVELSGPGGTSAAPPLYRWGPTAFDGSHRGSRLDPCSAEILQGWAPAGGGPDGSWFRVAPKSCGTPWACRRAGASPSRPGPGPSTVGQPTSPSALLGTGRPSPGPRPHPDFGATRNGQALAWSAAHHDLGAARIRPTSPGPRPSTDSALLGTTGTDRGTGPRPQRELRRYSEPRARSAGTGPARNANFGAPRNRECLVCTAVATSSRALEPGSVACRGLTATAPRSIVRVIELLSGCKGVSW